MRTLDEQIVYVKSKIGDLAAKEGKYKNRRTKLEQRLKTLLKHRQARLDSLHLAALQVRIDNDPAELARLQNTLAQLVLTDEERALVGLPANDTSDAGADVPDSGSAPPHAPRSSANDSAPVDPLGVEKPDATPSAPSNSPTATADGKALSPTDPVDGDAAPAQLTAPTAGADASAEPGDEPTEKQRKYLKDLIPKYPSKAQKIGISLESLPTLSKSKTSWAIQQLVSRP